MKTVLPALFLLFHTLVSVSAAGELSTEKCKDCVDRGCTYCKGDDFFKSGTGCVCDTSGFYGGCNDYYFGAEELSSNWDCVFETEDGEAVLAMLIIFPLVAVVCCICCCVLCCKCCNKRQPPLPPHQNYGAQLAPPPTIAPVAASTPTAPVYTTATPTYTVSGEAVVPAAASTSQFEDAIPIVSASELPPASNPDYRSERREPELEITVGTSSPDKMMRDLS